MKELHCVSNRNFRYTQNVWLMDENDMKLYSTAFFLAPMEKKI